GPGGQVDLRAQPASLRLPRHRRTCRPEPVAPRGSTGRSSPPSLLGGGSGRSPACLGPLASSAHRCLAAGPPRVRPTQLPAAFVVATPAAAERCSAASDERSG